MIETHIDSWLRPDMMKQLGKSVDVDAPILFEKRKQKTKNKKQKTKNEKRKTAGLHGLCINA